MENLCASRLRSTTYPMKVSKNPLPMRLGEITSRMVWGEMPTLAPSTTTSENSAPKDRPMKFISSFILWPLPTSPMRVDFAAQVSRTGRMRSNPSALQPTMAESWPASACTGVPPKGASTKCPPLSASSAASASVEAGVAVEGSITISPLRAPAKIPSGPRIVASIWGEFDRQMWMISQTSAIWRGLDASCAPMASRLSTGVRLARPRTQSSYPLTRMFLAIPWPMKPRPMKPMTGLSDMGGILCACVFVCGQPAEGFVGIARRQVFGTDGMPPAKGSDAVEHIGIVQLAMIGCGAVGDRGHLNMSDQRQQMRQPACHIAFDDLDVIAIKHQLQVRGGDLADDIRRLPRAVQEIAGGVIGVQRFDQDRHPVLRRHRAGIAQVGHKGRPCARAAAVARHDVNGFGVNGAGIVQRLIYRGLCLGFAARQGGKAVFADGGVAAVRVQAKHGKVGLLQGRAGVGCGRVIGPVTLYRVKACGLGGADGCRQRAVGP